MSRKSRSGISTKDIDVCPLDVRFGSSLREFVEDCKWDNWNKDHNR